jgi:hypothetical protein
LILGGLTSSIPIERTVPDYVPSTITWSDVTSNGMSGTTNIQQVTGINTNITLTVSWTGSLGYFYVSVNDSNAYGGRIFLLETSPQKIAVMPGQYVSFRVDAIGLQNNLTRSVTVTNFSNNNGAVDTVSITVDGTTTKSTNYDYNLFWDREMLVDRYDSASVSTTAQGWFTR